MLRRLLEGSQLLPAECNKNSPRPIGERAHGFGDIGGLAPTVACDRNPGRPAHRQQRDSRTPRRACRIGGNCPCVRVRCIDQRIDAFAAQIIGETIRAAEAADAHCNWLLARRCGTAGERDGDSKIRVCCKPRREATRLRRAAENEDASHGDC